MSRFNLQQFASSADYWRKREERNLKSNLKKEAEYDKEIERIYKDMLDSVQKEIDAFYGKYAKTEGITLAEAKKRVSRLDIEAYERKAKKYVDAAVKGKDGVAFSKQANDEMRIYNLTMKVNRFEMLKANIGLELIKGHAELETFMGKILKGRTEAELKRQAGILGETIRGNAKMANTIVNASFKNATFSDRIWMYHDQMKADLSKLLQSGMIQGKGSRQLAKDLRKYYYGPEYLKNGKKGAVYNTERLMRTELARVQTEAQRQAYIKEGTEEYKFMALGDACDICMAINGKSFKVKDMMPGENAPPMHPHCRCTTVSDDSKGREELDALLDFVSKGGTEADWNRFGKVAWKESGIINPIPNNKSQELTNRRKERLAARNAAKNNTLPDFSKMSNAELKNHAEKNLKTEFVDFTGVNNEYASDAVKVIAKFEQKMGGTIEGLKVQFGGLPRGVYAKFDEKTNTLILKKTGSKKAFEEAQKADNFRYKHKWKTDTPYHATETYTGTIWHELGHALDIMNNQNLSRALSKTAELDSLSARISGYARTTQNVRVTKRSEAWAENFAAYMEGGEMAKRVPTEIANMIDNGIKNASKPFANDDGSSKIKLNNKDVRKYYIENVSRIKDDIDKSLPLEEQAKIAFERRNSVRTEARKMMADKETRKRLDEERPNKTFEELVDSKMKRKGLTREEAIADVYETSTKTNKNVNKELGLE